MLSRKALIANIVLLFLFLVGIPLAAATPITRTLSATIKNITINPNGSDPSGIPFGLSSYSEGDKIDLLTISYDDTSKIAHIFSDYGQPVVTLNADSTPFDFLSDAQYALSPEILSILGEQSNTGDFAAYHSFVCRNEAYSCFDIYDDAVGYFTGFWGGTGVDAVLGASLQTFHDASLLTVEDLWFGTLDPENIKLQVTFESPSFVSDRGAPVPEPTTMLLFGIGLVGLAGARRRFKK